MTAQRIDFAHEGLLDGLQGKERDERLALLEELADDGVPLSELRRATASGTLMFLPADSLIVGAERYTLAEVAELSGLEPEFLVAIRRAMGLPVPDPGEALYTDVELESARIAKVGREAGISDEDMLDLVRVLGRGLSQVAESLRKIPLKRALEELEFFSREVRILGVYPAHPFRQESQSAGA